MKNINTTDGMDAVKTTQNTASDNIATSETKTGSVPVLSQLPEGYLANGYLDKNGDIDYKYFTTFADEIAQKLAPMGELFPEMYFMVEDIDMLSLSHQLQDINRLIPYAANLVEQGKAPTILLEFCRANAVSLKTKADCKTFLSHMEAICCYMNYSVT